MTLELRDNKTSDKTEKMPIQVLKICKKRSKLIIHSFGLDIRRLQLPAAGMNLNHRPFAQSRTRTLLLRSIAGPQAGHIPALQS